MTCDFMSNDEEILSQTEDPSLKTSTELMYPQWVRHSGQPISSIDIHPDGIIFVTAGWDKYAKIWSMEALNPNSKIKNKLLAILRDHTGTVNMVRFSPNGRYLGTCSDDGLVLVWQRSQSFGPPSVFGIPDSELSPNKPVQRWNSKRIACNENDVTGISWSADSRQLVHCTIDGQIECHDVQANSCLWRINAPSGLVSIAYDPLDQFIIAQTCHRSILLYTSKGEFINEISDGFDESAVQVAITSRVAWTPDGGFFGATSGSVGEQYFTPFFDRHDQQCAFAFEGHIAPTTCLRMPTALIQMDGDICSLLALGDSIGCLSVWIVGGRARPLFVLSRISRCNINDVAWSSDCATLLVAVDSDPIKHEGGIMAIKITNTNYTLIDKQRQADIQAHVRGFMMSSLGPEAQQIYERFKYESDTLPNLELQQFTPEDIISMQTETIVDGIRTIKPVLLNTVEKHEVAYTANVPVIDQLVPAPVTITSKRWLLPVQLPYPELFRITYGDSIIVAAGPLIIKLSQATGRYMNAPVNIGANCRLLNLSNQVLHAIGDSHFVILTDDMTIKSRSAVDPVFTRFKVIQDNLYGAVNNREYHIIRGKFIIGHRPIQSGDDLSLDEIEELANASEKTTAIRSWFEIISASYYESIHSQTDRQKFSALLPSRNQNEEYIRSQLIRTT